VFPHSASLITLTISFILGDLPLSFFTHGQISENVLNNLLNYNLVVFFLLNMKC
jgi:hypothetical protein